MRATDSRKGMRSPRPPCRILYPLVVPSGSTCFLPLKTRISLGLQTKRKLRRSRMKSPKATTTATAATSTSTAVSRPVTAGPTGAL